jgi:sulfur relay (sulfurtransferase) complex TusBCD TusD component (DsrE family)
MHPTKTLLFGIIAACFLLLGPAQAEEDKSMGLFINLSSFNTGQAGHALQLAGKMMKRGHPVTIFLNHKAVLYASKSAPQGTYPMSGQTLRDMLAGLMKDGAKVIVCQVCAKMSGVPAADLIDGAKLGNPDLVSADLFDPHYRVISW